MLNLGGLGFAFTAKDSGFGKAVDYMAGKMRGIADGLKSATDIGADAAPQFRGIFERMAQGAQMLPETLKAVRDQVVSDVGAMLDPMAQLTDRQAGIVRRFNEGWTKAGEGLTAFKTRFLDLGTTMGRWFVDKAKNASQNFRKAMQDLFQGQGLVGKGIARLRDAAIKLKAGLDPSAVKGFFKEFGGKAVDSAKDHISGLMNAHKNLTTGAEAEAASLAVEARKTAANLGYTGKELDKVSGQAASMAKGLDIGAEEAAKAIYNFGWAQEQFRALGLKSASDLAKFTTSFGVDQGKFTETLAVMTKELGVTAEQMPGLTGAFIAYGRSAGNIGGSLDDMQEAVKRVRGQAALLGRDLDPKQMASYVQQQAALTGIIYSATQDLEGAKALSAAFTEKSVESQKDLRNMFAGTADDLNDFQKELSVLGLNVSDSMKQMEQGPEGLMMTLAQMSQEAKKTEGGWARFTQFVGGRLGKVLGEEQTDQFINALRNMDATTIQMSKDAATASADLGKMAKEAWRSSKTLQDAFDSAQDALVSRFRRIGRSAAVDFVKDSVKAFDEFGKSLEAVAKEGGPMGQLVTKLSEIHQIGALALVPREMRGFASVLGAVTENAAPALTALGSLGFKFSTLANPAFLIGTAVAFIAAEFGALWFQTKSADKAFALLGDKLLAFKDKVVTFGVKAGNALLDFLVNSTGRMAAFATSFDWGRFFTALFANFGSGAKGASGAIQNALTDLWGVLEAVFSGKTPQAQTRLGKIAGSLLVSVRSIFEGLGNALAKIDWGSFLGRVFSALGSALGQVNQVFASIPWDRVFGGLFQVLRKVLGMLGSDTVWSFVQTMAGFLVKRATILVDAILSLLRNAAQFAATINWGAIVGGLARKLVTVLGDLIKSAVPLLGKVFQSLPMILSGALKTVLGLIRTLPTQIAGLLMTLGGKLKEILPPLIKTVGQGLLGVVKWLAIEGVPLLFDVLPSLLEGVADLAAGLGSLILDVLVGVGEGLVDLIGEWWDDAAPELAPFVQWFADLWEGVRDAARYTWDVLRYGAKATWDSVRNVWAAVEDFFGETFTAVADLGRELFDILLYAAQMTWDGLVMVWQETTGFFSGLFTSVATLGSDLAMSLVGALVGVWINYIQPAWEGFKLYVSGLFFSLQEATSGFVSGFVGIFTGAVDTVNGLFDSIFGKVQELFGHSVNTVVGADMEKTVGVVQEAAAQIQHDLEVSLFEAITKALQNAFQTAFTRIAETTKDFVKKEVDLLSQVVAGLKQSLLSMVTEVVTAIDSQFSAMEKRVTSLVKELRTIQAEIARAEAERAQEQARLVEEQKKLEQLKRAATSQEEALLRTIDYPAWWPLAQGMFSSSMSSLEATIRQGNAEVKAAIVDQGAKQAVRVARSAGGPGLGLESPLIPGASRGGLAMPVNILDTSILKFADLYLIDGSEFWGMNGAPPIEVQPDDLRHTVQDHDRLDSIAARYYGDPNLWWILAHANDIEDPITQLYAGLELVVPSPRYIRQEYFTLKQVE